MGKMIMILEVSQKQAYIFGSKELKDNIDRSNDIRWVTSGEYFEYACKNSDLYNKNENFVYSGGGHTVLEFALSENAIEFAKVVSYKVKKSYPEIELFIKSIPYDESKSPFENIENLHKALEEKKSLRRAVFFQKSFGIEDINDKEKMMAKNKDKYERKSYFDELESCMHPEKSDLAVKFEELGNSKGESSFIGVVHIDGNSMGVRVSNLYNQGWDTWDKYKLGIRQFSESIEDDFFTSYKEMVDIVEEQIHTENEFLGLENNKFPIRRIITAGDDICFVAEGRIALEAARIFMEKLNEKENKVDHERYSSCAGVTLVHQKYPFYKAYEMAESLCSNAKRYIATFKEKSDENIMLSAIDWHIEYGSLKENLAEIRKDYMTLDTKEGSNLILRPYVVCGDEEKMKLDKYRYYSNFSQLVEKINSGKLYARGKLKEFRTALKEGETKSKLYMELNRIKDMEFLVYRFGHNNPLEEDFKGKERSAFITDKAGLKRSLFFDAIEMMDTFIQLKDE